MLKYKTSRKVVITDPPKREISYKDLKAEDLIKEKPRTLLITRNPSNYQGLLIANKSLEFLSMAPSHPKPSKARIPKQIPV